jgi:hypothetical protein
MRRIHQIVERRIMVCMNCGEMQRLNEEINACLSILI